LPAPLLAAAESLRGPIGMVAPGISRQYGKIIRAARHQGQRRIFDLFAYNDPFRLPDLLTRNTIDHINGYVPQIMRTEGNPKPADGRDMIDVTMTVTLPGDYLRKIDVMSMAHGLEVRVPFLGKRMLDLAARIPSLEISRAQAQQGAAENAVAAVSARGNRHTNEIGVRHTPGHEPRRQPAAGDRDHAHRARCPHPFPDQPAVHANRRAGVRHRALAGTAMEPVSGLSERLHVVVARALAGEVESNHLIIGTS